MVILTALAVSSLLILLAYIDLFALLGHLMARTTDGRKEAEQPVEISFRFLILVPAHNEGENLIPTLSSLRRLDYSTHLFDVVVIADNCTDRTASVARQNGCQVWERSDPLRRGKGHALGWALGRMPSESYDAVAIIDADTQCSSNLLKVFSRELRFEETPVQASVELAFSAESPSWLSMTTRAAQRAEESYVSVPRSRFRLYQGLQGTGFCIPVKVLGDVPWMAFSICEDLEYAFQLATKRVAVRFVRDAIVTSAMTGRLEYATRQRQRWARGTYTLIAKLIPLQFASAIFNRDWRSLESCLYLATRSRLPLAVLTLLCGIGLLLVDGHGMPIVGMLYLLVVLMEISYGVAVVSAVRPKNGQLLLLLGFIRYSLWILQKHAAAILTFRRAGWDRTERG